MKIPFIIIAFALINVAVSQAQQTFDQSHKALTGILKTYVNEKGMVDYTKLKNNRTKLDNYVKANSRISKATFDTWSEAEQIAFLVNVYNSETLQLIIDNLPIDSIKNIGGRFKSPWKTKSVVLYGKTTTLDHVEHEILRKEYNEPRIHFALVCAAIGCPPLRTEAFTGRKLEAQLTDQAKVFMAETEKNRIEGDTLHLSSIFKWFTEDFTKNGQTLDQYVDPFIEGNSSGKKIEFTEYDWSLNKQ